MRKLVRSSVAVAILLAMAFGLTTLSPQSASAQQAPACQIIFNDDGSIVIQQPDPAPQACQDFINGTGSGACQIIVNDDGSAVVQGEGCNVQQSGGPCQATDSDADGFYDTFQGGCQGAAVQPTEVPATEVPATEVPATEVPATVVPTDTPGEPTAVPTDAPGEPTAVPTTAPGQPTAAPGGDDGDDGGDTVQVLPETGQGPDGGNGVSNAMLVLSFMGLALGGGALALRQRTIR